MCIYISKYKKITQIYISKCKKSHIFCILEYKLHLCIKRKMPFKIDVWIAVLTTARYTSSSLNLVFCSLLHLEIGAKTAKNMYLSAQIIKKTDKSHSFLSRFASTIRNSYSIFFSFHIHPKSSRCFLFLLYAFLLFFILVLAWNPSPCNSRSISRFALRAARSSSGIFLLCLQDFKGVYFDRGYSTFQLSFLLTDCFCASPNSSQPPPCLCWRNNIHIDGDRYCTCQCLY